MVKFLALWVKYSRRNCLSKTAKFLQHMQKVFNTTRVVFTGRVNVHELSIFKTDLFVTTSKNRIVYANETNIVNKDFPIEEERKYKIERA